ncbi:succinate dehydrogenase [Aestuariibius sp. 2305UL40-4]|uniref:succinate dehydrogenase n=1 Tax=Aestuariibius violaceus TaxID=3234132 RepID=UPI00345E353F
MSKQSLLALPFLLVACTSTPDTADTLAREAAKSVVSGVVATRFPGLDVAPVTDCIIDNASSSEILTIARAALTGPDARTTETIVAIAQRPETVRCIAQNGFDVFL